MISTILAMIAAAAVPAAPVAKAPNGTGPITGYYHVARGVYCMRSGWISASLDTRRTIRQGDCHTAAEWRVRGIAFDRPVVARAADQVAAR